MGRSLASGAADNVAHPIPAVAPETPNALVARALNDVPFAEVAVPPPPPVPGGDLNIDQLMTAALPPPVSATDLDTELAMAAPLPVAPVAAPVVPPPPVEAAAQNLQQARAVGDEQVAVATEKAQLDTAAADEKAAEQQAHAARVAEFTARHEQHRAEADAAIAERRAKAEAEPFHTLWESRTAGQKASIALGVILGGVSWNANHVNRGVEMLNRATEEEERIQRANHAELWKAVESAQADRKELDATQLRQLAEFSAKEGARADAVASRANAMAAANKGKGDVATLKKTALEFAEKATTNYQNATTAAAQANHMEEQNKLLAEQIKTQRTQQLLNEARAKGLTKKRGDGSGAGASPAITELTRLAETGAKTSELLDFAAKRGIPKALATVTKIQDGLRRDEGLAARETAAATKKAEDVRERTVNWPGGSGVAPTVKSAEEFRVFENSAQQVDGALKQLEANYKQYGTTPTSALPDFLKSKAARERAAIMESIVLPAKEVGRLGALAGPDKDILTNITGGKMAQILGDDLGIKNIRGWLQRARKSSKAALGITDAAKPGGPPPGSKAGRISNGTAVWKYPDGTIHTADGAEVTKL